MADCPQEIPLQEIYQKFPKSGKQRMNEALLKVYFSKEKDIRKCPKSNCKYAGLIIGTKSSCPAPLECGLCGTQWRDSTHNTKSQRIKGWFKNREKAKAEEDLSETWIKQKTKKCPSCKVNIEKNGGCNHMTCQKCSHEFYWISLQEISTHSPQTDPVISPRSSPPPIEFPFELRILFIAIILIIIFPAYCFGMIPIFKFSEGNSFWFIFQVICAIFYGLFSFLFNFIICNIFVGMALFTIFDESQSLKVKGVCFLIISVFVGFSEIADYSSTVFGILKIDLVVLSMGGLFVLYNRDYSD